MYHQKNRLRRDMMNNGKIYESVEKMLRESIVPSAEVSKRHNATYGASDFNAGMLHAAMLDTSVGGCSLVMREIMAHSIENPRYSRHSPSDEWFRNILPKAIFCMLALFTCRPIGTFLVNPQLRLRYRILRHVLYAGTVANDIAQGRLSFLQGLA